jgi:hypothetical protein
MLSVDVGKGENVGVVNDDLAVGASITGWQGDELGTRNPDINRLSVAAVLVYK